jgi:hypothetical protein
MARVKLNTRAIMVVRVTLLVTVNCNHGTRRPEPSSGADINNTCRVNMC